jgi:hypothetical protein
MSNWNNPYKRLTEIELKLKYLEGREQYWKGRTWKRKPKELEDVESEIMFLCFEENHIKLCIKYFEKKRTKEVCNRKNG